MTKRPVRPVIRLRGVRHNNLKNFDLDLPLRRLIVITGLSGSGKSSLAFDTLFAEGQRRYLETFSPYARQFFDRMDRPQVDRIDGIPPAIALEQRNTVRTTRSTVGTMTELCDHMKVLWPHVAQLHCRQCGRPVRKDSPRHIWETIQALAETNSTFSSNLPERAGANSDRFIEYEQVQMEPEALHDALVGSVGKKGNERGNSSSVPPHFALRTPHSPLEFLVTFNVPVSEKLSLDEIYDRLQEELRNQYYIGYIPTNLTKDGAWRKIDIEARRPGVQATTRAGYYAPTK